MIRTVEFLDCFFFFFFFFLTPTFFFHPEGRAGVPWKKGETVKDMYHLSLL